MDLGLLEDANQQSQRRGNLLVGQLPFFAGIALFGCACFSVGRRSQQTTAASNVELVEWEDPSERMEQRVEQTFNKTVAGVKGIVGGVGGELANAFNKTVGGVKGEVVEWKKAYDTALRKAQSAIPVKVASVKGALAAWNAAFNLSHPDASRQFFTKDAEVIYYNQAGRAQFRTYKGWPGIRKFMEYLHRVECDERKADFEESYVDEDGKTLFLVWRYPGTGCNETTETWVYTDDFLIKRITAYYNWRVDELAP